MRSTNRRRPLIPSERRWDYAHEAGIARGEARNTEGSRCRCDDAIVRRRCRLLVSSSQGSSSRGRTILLRAPNLAFLRRGVVSKLRQHAYFQPRERRLAAASTPGGCSRRVARSVGAARALPVPARAAVWGCGESARGALGGRHACALHRQACPQRLPQGAPSATAGPRGGLRRSLRAPCVAADARRTSVDRERPTPATPQTTAPPPQTDRRVTQRPGRRPRSWVRARW